MGSLIREIHFSKRGGALICGPHYFEKYGNIFLLEFIRDFDFKSFSILFSVIFFLFLLISFLSLINFIFFCFLLLFKVVRISFLLPGLFRQIAVSSQLSIFLLSKLYFFLIVLYHVKIYRNLSLLF